MFPGTSSTAAESYKTASAPRNLTASSSLELLQCMWSAGWSVSTQSQRAMLGMLVSYCGPLTAKPLQSSWRYAEHAPSIHRALTELLCCWRLIEIARVLRMWQPLCTVLAQDKQVAIPAKQLHSHCSAMMRVLLQLDVVSACAAHQNWVSPRDRQQAALGHRYVRSRGSARNLHMQSLSLITHLSYAMPWAQKPSRGAITWAPLSPIRIQRTIQTHPFLDTLPCICPLNT